MSFKQIPLFGGAITVDLPSNFGDVSDIRQVPDNQEVYLDSNGFTSIIFDICERVEKGDDEALKIHFEDLVRDSGDVSRVWEQGKGSLEKLKSTPTYTLLATQTPPNPPTPTSQISTTPPHRQPPSPDFTAILLCLVRLEAQKTDIVITVNVPHVKGEYVREEVDLEGDEGKLGGLVEDAKVVMGRIGESFEVREWGLFGDE